MTGRTDTRPEWDLHLSPADVASRIRRFHSGVGRKYNTNGDLWDAPDELVQTGLLNLILDELEKIPKPRQKVDVIAIHGEWLKQWRGRWVRLNNRLVKAVGRIGRFCNPELLPPSAVSGEDIERVAMYYRYDQCNTHSHVHYDIYRDFAKRVNLLESMRSIGDLLKLSGVGKKKLEKIKAAMGTDQ